MGTNLKSLVFLLGLCLLFTRCDDKVEEFGKLEITYKLQYGGKTLAMFDHYQYPNGDSLFFSRFSFYMSKLTLSNSDTSLRIEDISYNNLTTSHETKAKAEQGYVKTYDQIPTDVYSTISFGLGVPSEDNNKNPNNFPSSNVLSEATEYWAGWNSYIFAKTEGNIDLAGNGGYDTGVSLHLGSNDAFRNLSFSKPIEIKSDEVTKLTIFIDLRKEFENGTIYDIASDPQTHSLSQSAQVNQLATNLKTSFHLE